MYNCGETRLGERLRLFTDGCRFREAPHGLTDPVEVRFWIDGDLDKLFEQVKAFEVTIVQVPSDQPWDTAISWSPTQTGTWCG